MADTKITAVVNVPTDELVLRTELNSSTGAGEIGTADAGWYFSSDTVEWNLQELWAEKLNIDQTTPQAAVGQLQFPEARFWTATNKTTFEADWTMVASGDATVWKDSMIPANAFRTWWTALTIAQLIGNIRALRFDVWDILYLQVQLQHDMKVWTTIYPHLHLVNKDAIWATGYNVEITTETSWANIDSAFSVPAVTSTWLIKSFQNTAQYTHKIMNLATMIPTATQWWISSYVIFKIERTTCSVEPINPATTVFVFWMDIHYEVDTLGSRTITGK